MNNSEPSTDKPGFSLLKGMIWIVLIMAFLSIGWLAGRIDFDSYFKILPFNTDPESPWYLGAVGFALFGTVAISVFCPRQVVSFFAGYFFGIAWGFASALLATTFSCLIIYLLSSFFRTRARRFVKGRFKQVLDFWVANTFWATVLWRFVPAGSNILTNIAAGVFHIPAFRFVAGSAIGYIPHTLIFVLIGSGIQVGSNTQIFFSGMLFVISVTIGFLLYRRYRGRMSRFQINRA